MTPWEHIKIALGVIFTLLALGFAGHEDKVEAERTQTEVPTWELR